MNEQPATRQNLMGLDQQGLEAFFLDMGEKRFRARQVMQWIHQHGVLDFDSMTNLGKALRSRLAEVAEVRAPRVILRKQSDDGTRKWLLQLDGGGAVETVFIPESDRGTLCVSSQVGCALDCSFCSTAQQGLSRNMSSAEIISQLWLVRQELLAETGDSRAISNVVLMGMGEPLLNFNQVLPALRLMLDDFAYGLSKRRVTLSTAGVVPAMDRLREECDVALAVSLHAPDDPLRDELVPINRKFPVAELMDACRRYVRDRNHKTHVTFEYVMLDGVNDQPEQARALVKLLQGVPAKVNLIPFNPFPGTVYRCSPADVIARFQDILHHHGVRTITRRTRGDDIDAACGQLVGRVNGRARRIRRASGAAGVATA